MHKFQYLAGLCLGLESRKNLQRIEGINSDKERIKELHEKVGVGRTTNAI